MRITRIELGNWKNFIRADARLSPRTFVIGANGVGKSNLLDALRFLHDIAKATGGGLQEALDRRGGMGKIRSHFARQNPEVKICVEAGVEADGNLPNNWRYELRLRQEHGGRRRPLVSHEEVHFNGEQILNRPNKDDQADSELRMQTALEQTNANKDFRMLASFFQSFRYLHMVPQLVRHAPEFQGRILPDDPFGQGLMNAIAALPSNVRGSRLRRIGDALRKIMPRIGDERIPNPIRFERDEKTGKPHLMIRYRDWRSHGVWQTEEQLSDGALRLIGLIWALLEGEDVVMLEEPELSFNEGLVKWLPTLFGKAILSQRKGLSASQVILTTHSEALLSDHGIGGQEILILKQDTANEGTEVVRAVDVPEIRQQLDADLSVAEAALPFAQIGELTDL